jgi:hypothetical protein
MERNQQQNDTAFEARSDSSGCARKLLISNAMESIENERLILTQIFREETDTAIGMTQQGANGDARREKVF